MPNVSELIVQIMSGDLSTANETCTRIMTDKASEYIESMKTETMASMFEKKQG
jgi:hypothetical protein